MRLLASETIARDTAVLPHEHKSREFPKDKFNDPQVGFNGIYSTRVVRPTSVFATSWLFRGANVVILFGRKLV